MNLPDAPVRVAVVQRAPRFLDLEGSLEVLARSTAEAAAAGAAVVVFPETWLPGYPVWLDCAPGAALWDHPPAKEVFARLFANAVEVGDQAERRLAALAAEHRVVLATGVHERDGGSLYNTILYHGPGGELLGRHRKLVPTWSERMLWGRGDGTDLRAVATPAGRIGGLVCWEHWMPLARQAMHEQQEFLHVAAWPWVKEMHLLASRHYAFEGRCFVVAAGSVLRRDELPDLELFASIEGPGDALLLRGGSAILDPEGQVIAGPLGGEEGLLVADLDPRLWTEGRMTLDTAGHYARPDVFEFRVRGGEPPPPAQ